MIAMAKGKAERILAMAESLEALSEERFRPRETHTAKKLGYAMSARREGETAKLAAEYARAYAERLEAGTLPAELAGWKPSKKAFEAIAHKTGEYVSNGYHGYYVNGREFHEKGPVAVAVRGLVEVDPVKEAAVAKAAELASAEAALRSIDLPGFFPTPAPVIERMLELAEVEPGMRVLEPSAGKGDILEALAARGIRSDFCEIVPKLVNYLELRGAGKPVAWDFLELTEGGYDRMLMNPPFEKGAEMEHVRHAYELLAPGGRLVSVMSAGPFYRSDRKSVAFREWLSEVGGEVEELPADAFKSAFRSTGVSTRLVVVEKAPV